MEPDTRAEQKHSTKYTVKHKHKSEPFLTSRGGSNQKKKHRHRPQSIKSHGSYVLPRQVEAIMNQDQIEHKALDFSVIEDLYKNSAAPRYKHHWEPRENYNKQHHDKPKTVSEKKELAKYVHLPDIYEKLYIGNKYFAETYIFDRTLHFDIIINLSGEALAKQTDVKIYSYNVEDKPFATIYTSVCNSILNIIQDAENRGLHILINCKAGTNRSPFFAILYALKKHNNNDNNEKMVDRVNWWIDYIERCKANSGYKFWDTLTNRSFVNKLLSL